jgi:hypothetical protein
VVVRASVAIIALGLILAGQSDAQSLLSPEPLIPRGHFSNEKSSAEPAPVLIGPEKACAITSELPAEVREQCLADQRAYIDFVREYWAQAYTQVQSKCGELADRDHFSERNEILARCLDQNRPTPH